MGLDENHGPDFYENEFVDHFEEVFPLLFKRPTERVQIFRELAVGRAVADVVLALSSGKPSSTKRLTLSASECVVLANLRESGPTRIDLLERRCGELNGSLRNGALLGLEQDGLVQRGRGGRILARNRRDGTIRLIAIEAKLRRWREALQQAKSYLRYADLSYVLLPKEYSGMALEESNEFENAGIGLLVGDGDTLWEEIAAHKNTKHDWQREFVCSRIRAL